MDFVKNPVVRFRFFHLAGSFNKLDYGSVRLYSRGLWLDSSNEADRYFSQMPENLQSHR